MKKNKMQTLKDLFCAYKGRKFLFVQPGGNWGDHLIYFGAEHLAKQLGLNFQSYTKVQFLALDNIEDKVIYIHGGGAFNEWCSDSGFQLLARALEQQNNIVIYGPASSGENINFLERKFQACFKNNNSNECYLFAREQKTYQLFSDLSAITENAIVLKDIDTAFHLTKKAIIARVGEECNRYDFYAFREDNEMPDVSHEMSFKEVVFDPARWCDNFEHWMKVHLHAKKIVTNRTHSTIIGTILQKPTYMFSGSYHKNRSVWEESLQKRGVEWLEPEFAIGAVKKNWLDRFLPDWIKNSWKVKRAYWKWKKVP